MMDGAICVESVSGKGTAFVVDLPFIKGEALLDAQMPAGIEKLRVLAVDDEPAEREYISVVLGRIGVRYACVGDGKAEMCIRDRGRGVLGSLRRSLINAPNISMYMMRYMVTVRAESIW